MESERNIFSDFQDKKRQVRLLADEALKVGWIDEPTHAEILAKIDADVLTIGVIGQMKCGKSTFLNAFLFGRQLLPAATTPMTAALSVITYGEQEKVEVEFYTQQEWEELKTLALRDMEENSDSQTRSSIQAAKELYAKSEKICSQLPALLGTTRQDRIDHLIEYVGADGTYVSIVKSVRIYLPESWLKGVEIVDTPGFNDPVVSREERTKEFLKRADVVLMMLYAGRAFDATDRDILLTRCERWESARLFLQSISMTSNFFRTKVPKRSVATFWMNCARLNGSSRIRRSMKCSMIWIRYLSPHRWLCWPRCP